jgi:hypothetical protein
VRYIKESANFLMKKLRDLLDNFGKREELVYIVVLLWIIMGVLGAYKQANFTELAAYFGSLTAYVATYIWGESRRPSEKTGIMKQGPNSRREVMIYAIVALWAIVGGFAIWYKANLSDLAVYFVSLTGFVASWIAGEVYKPQDKVIVSKPKQQASFRKTPQVPLSKEDDEAKNIEI